MRDRSSMRVGRQCRKYPEYKAHAQTGERAAEIEVTLTAEMQGGLVKGPIQELELCLHIDCTSSPGQAYKGPCQGLHTMPEDGHWAPEGPAPVCGPGSDTGPPPLDP